MRSWKDRVSVSIPLLIKTAEEQAAAYEKIMGAFFENNQHMDPEERELDQTAAGGLQAVA